MLLLLTDCMLHIFYICNIYNKFSICIYSWFSRKLVKHLLAHHCSSCSIFIFVSNIFLLQSFYFGIQLKSKI